MWKIVELESNKKRITFQVREKDYLISHQHFLENLADNNEFILFYNRYLTGCSFDAFFWENKPVTKQNLNATYECTLVNSTFLAGVAPDPGTFQNYFEACRNVVSFPNLGGDAQLVVPCPVAEKSVYTQIGNFVRQAPESQILSFWDKVGAEMLNRISNKPTWLSTSGLGVFWLHARLDSVPKYYQTEEYKQV